MSTPEPTGGLMNGNRRTSRRVRQWSTGVGLAAAAAATIGMGTAHADTPVDVMGQAVSDLTQGATVLGTADTADLSTRQLDVLTAQEGISTQLDSGLTQLGSLQEELPAGAQSYLASADEQFVTAAQNLLSADQAFVAADQAGELSGGGNSLLPADLSLLEGDFDLLSADWHALGADFVAVFDPNIGTASAAATDASPAGLLSEATTNYTDANQLLAEIPGGEYAVVGTQTLAQDGYLQDIASAGSAESALTSYDNGALADLLNPAFSSVDQGWAQASEAALSADQAVETAVASGSATDISTALFGTIGPEYQALGPDFQSAFIDLAAHFLTGGDFTPAADLAAGVDPVSALDPSIFADLLSSIGL
jgi:hypothetical protein